MNGAAWLYPDFKVLLLSLPSALGARRVSAAEADEAMDPSPSGMAASPVSMDSSLPAKVLEVFQ